MEYQKSSIVNFRPLHPHLTQTEEIVPKSSLTNFQPIRPQPTTDNNTVVATLTFGQECAGLSLKNVKNSTKSKELKIRELYSQIFDLLHINMQTSDDEHERLLKIALDESQSTMRTSLRALTFGN